MFCYLDYFFPVSFFSIEWREETSKRATNFFISLPFLPPKQDTRHSKLDILVNYVVFMVNLIYAIVCVSEWVQCWRLEIRQNYNLWASKLSMPKGWDPLGLALCVASLRFWFKCKFRILLLRVSVGETSPFRTFNHDPRWVTSKYKIYLFAFAFLDRWMGETQCDEEIVYMYCFFIWEI